MVLVLLAYLYTFILYPMCLSPWGKKSLYVLSLLYWIVKLSVFVGCYCGAEDTFPRVDNKDF